MGDSIVPSEHDVRASAAQRRVLLTAALGFTRLRGHEPVPRVVLALSRWTNSWTGLGAIVVGMHVQGYDAQLQQCPEGWRADFYTTGMAHSILHGSAYRWRAVQTAAWEALTKPEDDAR